MGGGTRGASERGGDMAGGVGGPPDEAGDAPARSPELPHSRRRRGETPARDRGGPNEACISFLPCNSLM